MLDETTVKNNLMDPRDLEGSALSDGNGNRIIQRVVRHRIGAVVFTQENVEIADILMRNNFGRTSLLSFEH